VDEWGPYDWQSPKLWPAGRSDETPLRLRVLGPEGTWRLDEVRGAKVSATSGSIPGELTLTAAPGNAVDMSVRLRDNRGRGFGYERFFLPMLWSVRFHDFGHDPKLPDNPEAFGRLLAGQPVSLTRVQRLQFLSSRALADDVPVNHVAIAASADVEVPAGAYDLQVISDDGVRVWVDDRQVIDRWEAHESAVDRAPITRGKHKLRVEYYELIGFAELRVDVVRRR
jgi:PA14 domain